MSLLEGYKSTFKGYKQLSDSLNRFLEIYGSKTTKDFGVDMIGSTGLISS